MEFELHKTYVTRGGQLATIIANDLEGDYPVAALLHKDGEAYSKIVQYTKQGFEYEVGKSWDDLMYLLGDCPFPESSKLDWSKPIQTRSGKKARVVACLPSNGEDVNYPMLVSVTNFANGETVEAYTKDGNWSAYIRNQAVDIINVPDPNTDTDLNQEVEIETDTDLNQEVETETVYMLMYRLKNWNLYSHGPFSSHEEALSYGRKIIGVKYMMAHPVTVPKQVRNT